MSMHNERQGERLNQQCKLREFIDCSLLPNANINVSKFSERAVSVSDWLLDLIFFGQSKQTR